MTNLINLKAYQKCIDSFYQEELGKNIKFSMLTSTTPTNINQEEIKGFKKKYKTIRKFQKVTNELFKKSLFDSSLKEVRDLLLNEVNSEFGLGYHRNLYKNKISLPYFFRTDEGVPNKIVEIQCPASGWGMLDVLQRSIFKLKEYKNIKIRNFNKMSVAEKLSKIIKRLTKNNPLLFHLIDTSSDILGMNYFILRTRKFGLKYVGWDNEAFFRSVNFIRTHSFIGQVTHGCFFDFLKRYHSGDLTFDLFPSIIFDEKIPLTFPFWEQTRRFYSADIRRIFPFSSLVKNNTVELENGKKVSIRTFWSYPPRKRRYYLKYAGADEKVKWGSRAVYGLAHCDRSQCKALLTKASEGFENNQLWILQKEYYRKEEVDFMSDRKIERERLYSKYSGFYGPDGFMGGFVMNGTFHKVHGQQNVVNRLIL